MVALELGFHSLVEVLLRGGAHVHTVYRYCPMRLALSRKRLDFVQLLVTHGFDLDHLDLAELFRTRSSEILRWVVEQGLDITREFALAHALIDRIRPAVNLVRDFRQTLPGVQQQANIALRHHCEKGNKKWVSLLLWAGADPKETGYTVPAPPPYESPKSAIGFATEWGHTELLSLKALRECMSNDAALEILKHGALPESMQVLTNFFADGLCPNDQPNGGCSRMQELIEGLRYSYHCRLDQMLKRESRDRLEQMKSIHFLAKYGARWIPTYADVASARRAFLEVLPDYATEIVWLSLRYGLATHQTLTELLRTPGMQRHVAPLKSRLQELLQQLERKQQL